MKPKRTFSRNADRAMPALESDRWSPRSMPSKALAGVKVLDLSRVLAAPLAGQMLADLGAEVVKVERPGVGDESRGYGPPFLKDAQGEPTRDAAFYFSCNRNKRSLTLDLATPEGQEIVRKLAARSDVLLENFKAGSLAKYGLDYASLKAVNPRLIYCSVTGYGQDGPMAPKPGYDGVFQAMSGMMSASGHRDEPMKVGVSMVDVLTSLYAANAVLTALYHRDLHGGPGQHIDMALLDCGLAALSHFAMNYLVSGEVPERRGNGGYGGVPSQAFRCADKQIFVVAGNNDHFARLCQVLGRPELPGDRRFCDTSRRIENRPALLEILDEVFLTRRAGEWLEMLDRASVAAGPVNDIAEALEEPQVKHRRMVRQVPHASGAELKILANPIRLSETPIEGYQAPPTVGQHTEEVLAELGYGPAERERLRARRIT
jgi:crotonobetainyl-CoA:carnitine CoA-transferase CaiB-like acyl-CoA transferase